MTKNGKIFIILGSIVAVLVILNSIILVSTGYKMNQANKERVKSVDEENKYVTILSDGTKENTSEKLKEKKSFDGLEITDIKLTENNQKTTLTGTITNNTNKIKGDYIVNAIFVDSKGNELAEMSFYVKQLQSGESTVLNAATTFDYSNAYNIIFKK